MKKIALIIAIILACVPQQTLALAGWAERYSTHHFTEGLQINWGRPWGSCPNEGQICFFIEDTQTGGHLEGLERLDTIMVFGENTDDHILAREAGSKEWIIYNLKEQRMIASSESLLEIEEEWLQLDRSMEVLATVDNFGEYYQETVESVLKNKEHDWLILKLFFIGPLMLLGVCLLISGAFTYIFIRLLNKGEGERFSDWKFILSIIGVILGALMILMIRFIF